MARRTKRTTPASEERLLRLPANATILQRWSGGADDAFAQFQQLALSLLRDRPRTALEVVEHLRLAEAVDDDLDRARLLRLRAHALMATGAVTEAIDTYEAAARRFEALDDATEAAKTVIGWADALALSGDVRSAIERLEEFGARLPARHPARPRLDGTTATVHYHAGRFDDAERLYRRALDRSRRHENDVDAAVSRFNLANIALRRGRAARAAELYREAAESFERRSMTLAVLQCRYGLAAVRLHVGEWAAALEDFDRVGTELRELGDRRGAAAVDLDAAELLIGIGADLVAEVHARRARAEYKALGLGAERARAAALQARILMRLGRYREAASRLTEARGLYARMGRSDVLLRLDLEQAKVALARGSTDGLARRLSSLQRRFERDDDRPSRIRCLALRAQLSLDRGAGARALEFARKAYDLARAPALRTRRPALASLVARCHSAKGDGRQAVTWARRSVRQLEELRLQLGASADALGLGHAQRSIAGTAVDIVLEHGGPKAADHALRILLGVRAGSVVDDLLRGRRRETSESVRTALARLRDQLLGDESDWGDVRGRSLRGEVARLENSLRWGDEEGSIPGVHSLRPEGAVVWEVKATAAPVVIYDETEVGWRAFVLEGRRVRCVTLDEAPAAIRDAWMPLRMTLEALARTQPSARQRLIGRTESEARRALVTLADALWKPLQLETDRAVVVGSGPINGIPLEAALVEAHAEAAPVLSRIPHPALMRDGTRRPRKHALLVEGTVPGAAAELGRVRRHLAASGWSARTARTRESFLVDEKPCGVVHFATHGSYHRTAWISNGLQMPDGWIGFEQLSSRLVSDALLYFDSCESGLEHRAPGAQLDGWASAAFAAGAEETVLHLWKLDDASATEIADAFYDNWTSGHEAALAMHGARLRVRGHAPHPFHWASGIVSSRRNPD